MSVVLLPPSRIFAALRNNANGCKIDCGSAAMLDNLATLTLVTWLRNTSLSTARGLFNKRSGGTGGWNITTTNDTTGNINLLNNRLTTDLNYATSSTPLVPAGAWKCLAFTKDQAAAASQIVHIYRGDVNTPATECTYGTQTDGSGTFKDESANPLILAGDTGGFNLVGDIGPTILVNRVMSLADIRAWQRNPSVLPPGTVGAWLPGAEGTGLVLDRSGNANHGTITSMIPVPGLPIGMPSRARSLSLAKAGPAAYSLTAASGAFTLTGGAVTTKIKTPMAGGSYTLTGGAALPKIRLLSAAGSYTLSGGSALPKIKLSCVGGSYSLTGGAALFKIKLLSAGGTYALTGGSATLRAALKLAAATGSYTLTGGAALPKIKLPVGAGIYALTGGAVLLKIELSAGTGSYTLSGGAANLRGVLFLAAAPGTYALTGGTATLRGGFKVSAASGSYTRSGVAVTLKIKLPVAGGSYTLSGGTANLAGAAVLSAASGSFSLIGSAINPKIKTPVTGGTYSLGGSAVAFHSAFRLSALAGSYALTGIATTLRLQARLVAATGSWTLLGGAEHGAIHTSAQSGAYVLSGSAAQFSTTGGGAESRQVITVGTPIFAGRSTDDVLFATASAGEVSLV